jgi:hypothetical protein
VCCGALWVWVWPVFRFNLGLFGRERCLPRDPNVGFSTTRTPRAGDLLFIIPSLVAIASLHTVRYRYRTLRFFRYPSRSLLGRVRHPSTSLTVPFHQPARTCYHSPRTFCFSTDRFDIPHTLGALWITAQQTVVPACGFLTISSWCLWCPTAGNAWYHGPHCECATERCVWVRVDTEHKL